MFFAQNSEHLVKFGFVRNLASNKQQCKHLSIVNYAWTRLGKSVCNLEKALNCGGKTPQKGQSCPNIPIFTQTRMKRVDGAQIEKIIIFCVVF